ncbi:MAG: ABC transporter substrate-binding protein [Alphaproteobacteria bacterium]|nr:ABC transporter substrate-binding protein [Alphaproteobacteria bacterium]
MKAALLIFSFALLGISESSFATDKNSHPLPAHAIAMHGSPKYAKDFKHFSYVNPSAPKGGTLNLYSFGNFDSLNPYILKGIPPSGIELTFDTLMTSAKDEPFTEYGLLAESVEVPADRSYIAFNLRKEARFHDHSPVTADDVVFSFKVLKEKGNPLYRYYYANVAKVETTSPHRVLFTFDKKADNRELPLILGQLPVFSAKSWEGKDFAATTLTPIIGSGPYKISAFEPGRYIVYERNPDYWGKDLPVNVGNYNFSKVKYDFYRDSTVALEAFKSGAFDLRIENEAKKWGTGYNFPAYEKGLVKKAEFRHHLPSGMQGFVFNTRKDIFKDRKVREALSYAFDFEWSNKHLFYDLYSRTKSFFDNSAMAATGLPSAKELKLLKPWEQQLPPEVFTSVYNPPETDGKGNVRPNLLKAFALLKEAGWEYKNGRLENAEGKPFAFEIMLDTASAGAWERITLPFVRNLKRLGIDARIRVVDVTQNQNRINSFDFDMITAVWGQSLSPGNEQRSYWGSAAADQAGSRNYSGIKNPAVDAIIEEIISAKDDKALNTAVKALDRVLLWGYYVIPQWHTKVTRIAFWDKFGMPETIPMQGVDIMNWWYDTEKAARLETRKPISKEDAS